MIISEEVTINLDDYVDECKEALENNNYKVIKSEKYEIYYKIKDYIKQMGKNLMYLDDRDTKKTYAEIYYDLNRILRGI